ncbi:MAG: hypothetical protein OCD01_13945 [Fibrobacterales bacterium]
MNTQQPKYLLLTQNVQEIQKGYLNIHNSVFSFSLKKIFPLSLLYGSQNFELYTSVLQKIRTTLKDQITFINSEIKAIHPEPVRNYYIKLKSYLQQLEASILILSQICQNLLLLQAKSPDFSIKGHNQLIKKYQQHVTSHGEHGRTLNALLHTITHPN